ncbi:MAG: DNA primase [Gammaproteobacteria bacterium]|nr:DNA primase [Rhodocyclaceae bacterium]MBU3909324.1 DNA primase [Gammaproteobacteria bacterium]MBU3989333.1 DNA primase [Gammaproteobacteria bacterium]MBU4005516.1 DNA primase [Gammaproteobacteria bacterium]MBU4020931.1 DNA primase [Gammaproteobacteria bacterium]
MIPDSFIQELLARVDIVDVVERYVQLKKAGANYQACCPFHSEKTPSFTVSPAKQFFHCFGCGAHGSAVGFVMQYAGLGFVEAVEDLANSLGMPVPREVGAHSQQKAQQAPLTERMARAARFYKDQLKASPKAIDYLKGRGLTGEIAARYGLGYAPDEWQGLQQVFDDYESPALVECGLVIENEQGRRYDRFRDRVMFPIQDQRGNVIGFGGRVLGQGEPKYLNSPETPLFHKGQELYGLPQARKEIQQQNMVIVVEGYMDVVGLAQNGVVNVVATLGTAATGINVQRLVRLADRVVFCFDRDSAGDRAARRAMEVSLEHLVDGKSVEILQLDGTQDPDEFVREFGKEAFINQTKDATRLSDFLVRKLIQDCSTSTAEGRAKLVSEAKPLLQKISAPVLRVQITKQIAKHAQLSQAELEAQCGIKPLTRNRAAPPPSRLRPAPNALERTLLVTVLCRPERAARLPLDLLSRENAEGAALLAVAEAIDHAALAGGNHGLLIEYFRDTPHEEVIAALSGHIEENAGDEGEQEDVFIDAIERLRGRALSRQIDELNAKARARTLSPAEMQTLKGLLDRKRA